MIFVGNLDQTLHRATVMFIFSCCYVFVSLGSVFPTESSDPKRSRTFLCFTTFSLKGLYAFFQCETHWLGGQGVGLSLPVCPPLIVMDPLDYNTGPFSSSVPEVWFLSPLAVIFLPISAVLWAGKGAKKGARTREGREGRECIPGRAKGISRGPEARICWSIWNKGEARHLRWQD